MVDHFQLRLCSNFGSCYHWDFPATYSVWHNKPLCRQKLFEGSHFEMKIIFVQMRWDKETRLHVLDPIPIEVGFSLEHDPHIEEMLLLPHNNSFHQSPITCSGGKIGRFPQDVYPEFGDPLVIGKQKTSCVNHFHFDSSSFCLEHSDCKKRFGRGSERFNSWSTQNYL